VTLNGSGLLGPDTTVLVGDLARDPEPGGSPTRLVVRLPSAAMAGVLPVRVRHSVTVGAVRKDFELSNALTLTVRPVPESATVVPATPALPERVRVTFSPPAHPDQEVALLLTRLGSTASVRLAATPLSAPSSTVEFPVPTGRRAGTYLYQLSVDGAASVLRQPDGGPFDGPTVVLP
jgi:hypothetical protein